MTSPALAIPWSPRLILAGRAFRLPVRAAQAPIEIQAPGFALLGRRWSSLDQAWYCYLRAPQPSGDYTLGISQEGQTARTAVQVRVLDQLRQPHSFNGAVWPRRWPVGQDWVSTKTRQTLQAYPKPAADPAVVGWWLAQDDSTLWRQLPPAELPRAHFVNVHQGCPNCGTAVYRYGGFYPWTRNHLPCDFRSTCPSCQRVFPSNDLMAGDFTGGDFTDDGYGYFDTGGHLFLFAATYHRDQTRACWAGMDQFTRQLRDRFEPETARRLGLMLLRQAVEEAYLAAVPQFRYGPTLGVETPWEWGQPDWAAQPDPIGALHRKGTVHYCIDIPYVVEVLALAYDTIWAFLGQDQELVERAQRQGAPVESPAQVVQLIEEMLACLLQCAQDGGAVSNLPRVSQAVLVLLRVLDRADAQPVLEWLYDRGPDKMKVFGTNDFCPDGTPPEATGGYNDIHSLGLFALEHHLRQLRQLHPRAYPESAFPSLVEDPRAAHVARAPHEITLVGKTHFQIGDGGGPGHQPLPVDAYPHPLPPETLAQAAAFTGDPLLARIRDAAAEKQPLPWGLTVHDGGGIAILRTGEIPERAAAGIAYGDATGHRHLDLLDVQLFAFGQPFLSDLGYPQSWGSIDYWEAHWATHNAAWGVVPGLATGRTGGRGRLVRLLCAEGVQVLELEAERWAWDAEGKRWYRPGVYFRRLLALVETGGQGVALIDLSRVKGGSEHWRICRGLEADAFAADLAIRKLGGTVADPQGQRGQQKGLIHPDYAGLAWMDAVEHLEDRPAWKGTWACRRRPDAWLDLHQLHITPGTQLLSARATATMGTPEESTYHFRPLLWKHTPQPGQTTCVDLVFEPRLGPATLAAVRPIPAGREEATGVELVSAGGRAVKLYWNPEADAAVRFGDGASLQGSLAVVVDGKISAVGVSSFTAGGKSLACAQPMQPGRIIAVDRQACTVEVEGLQGIAVGDRVRINPQGRGHNYRVEEVRELGGGRLRLRLDVTSLLGRGRVKAVQGQQVKLEYHIMARTGNLHLTRLEREEGTGWGEIREANNPDADHTAVELDRPLDLKPGEWVNVVDGVAGDELVFEPLCRA
ncbi:MAG: heparinase II/III family protein [Candidatus Handelsmanbacteria bacterium]|nr:heparinase II/III family protein [Candidatus Handelsmanbacteria bacterium]